MSAAEVIGYAASVCTTFSFVPQIVRILRTRDVAAISLPMYATYTVGIGLWFAYGLAIVSYPVIVSNAVTLVFSASVLVLKLAYLRARVGRADTKTHFESP
jgi:MtN3 and saliva related transmembrane protein